jgi:hypothetical protein
VSEERLSLKSEVSLRSQAVGRYDFSRVQRPGSGVLPKWVRRTILAAIVTEVVRLVFQLLFT